MSQEKQKVIRVLKPAKKTKKLSPLYYGIAGVTLGVALTSVLIFSVLGKDSTLSPSQTVNVTSTEQANEDVNQNNLNASTNTTAMDIDNQAENDQNFEDQNAHDGFNIPQPRANEINGIFTHKKSNQAQEIKQVPANDNPFEALSGQVKSEKSQIASVKTHPPAVTKAVVTPAKANPSVVLKAQASKSVDAATDKINNEAKHLDAKNIPLNPMKVPTKDKEPDVETPNATVQISVTRSVKE